MDLYTLPVKRLRELTAKKEVGCEEITRAFLERINKVEPENNAFITVTGEQALLQARAADEKRIRGEASESFAGIPMAVDDNICTAGVKTTCASQILHNYVPPFSATVVERLQGLGAVLVGKCNMDEFAMGLTTENSGFFRTKNPYDRDAVPGGSAGGAAVAAGEAAFALGMDAGGSLRQSAAYCGVIGMTPTFGYVSRYGLITSATSLEQLGCYARDMEDVALLLNAICGHDDKDSMSLAAEVPDFSCYLQDSVKGVTIGLPKEYLEDATSQTAAGIREAVGILEQLGAIFVEVSMPQCTAAPAAHYLISCAEASSNLARLDGVRYGLRADADDLSGMFRQTRSQGFGAEVKRRILMGTYVLSNRNYDEYYTKALKIRTLVKQDFERALQQCDCLLTPAFSVTAKQAGERTGDAPAFADLYNVGASLAGLPAMSLPFGLVDGLPAGLQLIARPFREGTLLRVGYALEQHSDQTRLTPGAGRQ